MPNLQDRRSSIIEFEARVSEINSRVRATWTGPLRNAAKPVTDKWPNELAARGTTLRGVVASYRPLVEVEPPVTPRSAALAAIVDAAEAYCTDLQTTSTALNDAMAFKPDLERATITSARDALDEARVDLRGWVEGLRQFDTSIEAYTTLANETLAPMSRYFLYVGTKLVGANEPAWGKKPDVAPSSLDVCEAPFDGRWVDAGNLALTKYLPNGGKGWSLLLNTAGDHNPLADGIRHFERFEPIAGVDRGANDAPKPSDALAYGLAKDSTWAAVDLPTTSIMQGDLIAAALQHGKLQQHVTLVDNSGPLQTGNNSGHVAKEKLDELCAAFQAQLQLPAFTVTDSNTFHTSGYLWAKVAVDAAILAGGLDSDDLVLIVNFDQHKDYDAQARLVKSDGWGKAILRNYKGAFINFGCIGMNELALVSEGFVLATNDVPNNAPTVVKNVVADPAHKIVMNHFVGLENASTMAKVDYAAVAPNLVFLAENIPFTLDAIAARLRGRFKYCFVTVDRDCMLNNGTQWGMAEPAFWSAAHLRSVIRILFEYLGRKQITLTGFDITGLPEALASANPLRTEIRGKVTNIPDLPVGEDMMAAVKQEIADFEALLAVYEAAHAAGPLYRIRASSMYPNDSLTLDYSLRDVGNHVIMNGKLDRKGMGYFRATTLANWAIGFPRLERLAYSPIQLGANMAIGSARYTYEITKVY